MKAEVKMRNWEETNKTFAPRRYGWKLNFHCGCTMTSPAAIQACPSCGDKLKSVAFDRDGE